MGNLYHSPNEPAIQDLKLSIHHSTLVYPCKQTPDDDNIKSSIFLSNIDKVLNFHVQTLHFFPKNPDFPIETVVVRLKNALQKMMAEAYDFLGGRFKMNPQTGRLEVDRNGAGAGFVVGSTEYSLEEIGDLVYPNPAFMQLIIPALQTFHDHPLVVIQVTSFKCGGFVIALSTNHGLFDGLSFKIFLQNLASQAFPDKPLHVIPCNDRRLLAARSPPQITFPHPELLKMKLPIGEEETPSPMDPNQDDLDFKIFRLSPNDISFLKEKAKADGTSAATKITGFNVITAHIWRCKALSCSDNDGDRESMVLFSVDIRPRLRPPLPASFCGNAILTAYAAAMCAELETAPLGKLVDMVSEGAARMTDEYARSAIDWGEVNKGFPNGEFLISSWWRLGFEEVDYPWGKPRYSCPLVFRRKDIILLFPEVGGVSSNGVNVLVTLPALEMEKFQLLFKGYLA